MSSRGKTSRRPPRRTHKESGGAPPRLDAANLAGFTSLMNPQHLRAEVDLETAEQTIMGKAGPVPKRATEVDPVELYTQELNELAEELGINFLDDAGGEAAPPKEAPATRGPAPAARPQNPHRTGIDNLLGELDLDADSGASEAASEEDSSDSGGGDVSEGSDSFSSGDDSVDGSGDGSASSSAEEDPSDDDSVISNLEKQLGIDLDGTRRRGKRRLKVHDVPARGDPGRSRLGRLTEEQERRRHINSVMGDMRQETRTSFGVEHERVQDVKASKLEQIGQLRMTLQEEGIDCGGVGDPTMASPVDEIDSVLNILKLKNDRNRYSSLAEEVILGAAEGIETVFDGTREIPVVGFKPDYTGYHNTVNIKLHRMRFETSQVVGNVIEKYNIGPSSRIVMELLPSFFLYPRQQKKQRGSPGLHADFGSGGSPPDRSRGPQVSDARVAYAAIRRADTPDTLDGIADI